MVAEGRRQGRRQGGCGYQRYEAPAAQYRCGGDHARGRGQGRLRHGSGGADGRREGRHPQPREQHGAEPDLFRQLQLRRSRNRKGRQALRSRRRRDLDGRCERRRHLHLLHSRRQEALHGYAVYEHAAGQGQRQLEGRSGRGRLLYREHRPRERPHGVVCRQGLLERVLQEQRRRPLHPAVLSGR